ncbi:MAG: hypothetical protein KC583_03845, partial [Myxococcales bacterium]|nr:hypothetical protein [Myxococcales bacterium]
ELEARALSGLADADFAAGELPTARARYAACVALCGEVGLERYAIPNRLMQAFLDFWHDADRDVLVTFEELSRLAERLGERYPLMLTEMQRALVLVYRGRPADAVEQARRGRAEAERLGAHRYAGELEAVMAEALARAGDRPAALAAAERAVAIARAHGEAFCGPMSLGALAWLTEDPGQRREIIAEAERIIATGTLLFNVVTFHRHVVEGAVEEAAAQPPQADGGAEDVALTQEGRDDGQRHQQLHQRAAGHGQEAAAPAEDQVARLVEDQVDPVHPQVHRRAVPLQLGEDEAGGPQQQHHPRGDAPPVHHRVHRDVLGLDPGTHGRPAAVQQAGGGGR